MRKNEFLRDTKDILEGNSLAGLVLGIKEVIEDFKKGCAVLSSCGGNTKIDWDNEDTSSILVEEFHY